MTEASPTRHHAATRDGWRITLHHRPPRPAAHASPVILCHGMGSNRYNVDGPGRTSLARFLQRRGYDVWVLELRGAGCSRRLLRLPPVPYRWSFEDYVHHEGLKVASLLLAKFAHVALAVTAVYALLVLAFGSAGAPA